MAYDKTKSLESQLATMTDEECFERLTELLAEQKQTRMERDALMSLVEERDPSLAMKVRASLRSLKSIPGRSTQD